MQIKVKEKTSQASTDKTNHSNTPAKNYHVILILTPYLNNPLLISHLLPGAVEYIQSGGIQFQDKEAEKHAFLAVVVGE